MTRMYQWLGVLTVSLVGVLSVPTHAETTEKPLRMAEMKVSIWPEYDDSRVFVTIHGTLESEATLPTELRLLVPAGAEVTSTCAMTPEGEHQCQLPRFENLPEGKEVRFTLPTRQFSTELYYDAEIDGAQRSIAYPFVATYSIGKLDVEVQRPLRSVDFGVEPTADQTTTDDRGFEYHVRSYQDVPLGQALTTKVEYRKDDTRPSVDAKSGGNATAAHVGGEASKGLSARRYVVAFSVLATMALGIGAHFAQSAYGRGRSGAGRQPDSRTAGSEAFCAECGSETHVDDRFCTNCGHRLR